MVFNHKASYLYLTQTNSNTCPIYNIWQESKRIRWRFSKLFWRKNFHLLDKWYDKYSLFIRDRKKAPKNLAVLGYKDPQYPILVAIEMKPISSDWFDINFTNSVGVFLVNGGGHIIKREEWKNLFKSYVFFEDKFDFLVGLSNFEKDRKIIFSEIFAVLLRYDDPKKIKEKMVQIFERALYRVSNEPNIYPDVMELVYRLRINKLNLSCH